MRRMGLWLVVLVFACTPLFSSATVAKQFDGGSNPAGFCKGTGYLGFTTTKGTRFANIDECKRYAQRGGVLVPVYPELTLSFSWAKEDGPYFYNVHVTGSGLYPDWPVTIQYQRTDGSSSGFIIATVPQSGVVDITARVSCGFPGHGFAQSLTWDDTVITTVWRDVPC